MRRMGMAGALLAACSVSLGWAVAQEPENKAEDAKSDQARMQGAWISREPVGPAREQFTMTVQGSQCEVKAARSGAAFKGTLTLNPAANPKQADFAVKESPDPDQKYVGKSALGIYKIGEDGTLTLAANEPGVAVRPEKFEAIDQTIVFVFEKWRPGMTLPGNPPELKVLERRIGTWATQTVAKPGPWAPAGRTVTGIETTEWILGGRFQQTRNANRPGSPDNLFLCTYDTQLKAYRALNLDDQGYINEMTGQWDDAAQTLNWTSDGKNGFRAVAAIRFVGPDNTEWEMTIKAQDGKVMLEMAGKLVRKK